MTIQDAKKIAISKFVSSSTPALDADLLLEYVTGFARAEIILRRESELTSEQETLFFDAVAKRADGLPVAYITGHKEFYGLDFVVTQDVLIPKPDTEILVEKAIQVIQKLEEIEVSAATATLTVPIEKSGVSSNSKLKICDVCTGSGCVGISILHNVVSDKIKKCAVDTSSANFELTMTDISAAALAIAKKNAERLLIAEHFSSVNFLQGDLLDSLDDKAHLFDIIVSNPPYVPRAMVDELLKDGRSEPRLALDGDVERTENGLAIIRRLVPESFTHLRSGGYFLCECGEYNAYEAARLFEAAGFCEVTVYDDLAGTPRVVSGMK